MEPLPSPRLRELKKPVPTPRRSIKSNLQQISEHSKSEESAKEHLSNVLNIPPPKIETNNKLVSTESLCSSNEETTHTNTLTRKVSSVSKQLADDISQLVQDRKRAVIEGTRQSVRRITRRFSSSSQSENASEETEPPMKGDEDSISLFSAITFSSPLFSSENIYNNAESESRSTSSEENSIGLPPPSHPPPPLPDESLYDAPSSISSSGNSGNSFPSKRENYESVFPIVCEPNVSNVNDNFNYLFRSDSWKFYDSVTSKDGKTNCVNPLDNTSKGSDTKINNEDLNLQVTEKVERSASGRSTVYENHEIQLQIPPTRPPRPSKSVILQFDPLTRPENIPISLDIGPSPNDIKSLEEMLQGDLYGNISNAHTLDEWSISNDSETDDVISPPTPPIRVDSLPEDEQETEKNNQKSKTNWYTQDNQESKPTLTEPKKSNWFKQVKGVLEKAPEVVRGIKNRDNVVNRAAIGVNMIIQKKGMLYKVQNGPVEDLFGEYSGRWCILENSSLLCYSDNSCQNLKEHFPAQNILSVQLLQDKKYNYKYDNDELYCFELNTTGKTRGGHIYGSRNSAERRIWVQFICESLTCRFSTKITTNINRMGWAYLREGVSGKWMGAWIVLTQREFCYVVDGQPVKHMDLRKARCIVLQPYSDTDNNPKTNDKGPNMLIDCPNMVLYLRMWTSRETKVWCHIVKLEAHNNGANIDQHQLTKNDIPVVVEKCINFIYAHGSMTEGIYRRPGQGSLVSELLTKFRKDAFAVQLTSDLCTELEVATALKRFFRDLPEPLLGSNQRQYFYEVSKHKNKEEKIRMYKAALDQLPTVSYNTTRKLIGHLHFISSQSSKNLMTVENLSSIWGPTLMHYEDVDGEINVNHDHQLDTEVVSQLIRYYRHIFPEDPGDLEKEKMMLRVLEKYSKSQQSKVANKSAGDLRIWVYLHNKEGQSYNVSVGPNKTAYDICKELSSNIKFAVHELVLEEIILNDKLIRPIHYQEKVLNVVLKWGYWDEQDRKDNYLTLAPLSKYWEYILDKPYPVSGEMRFADSKTRLFKLFTFQFSQGKLTCFKDKSGEVTLNCWNIEDIVWYLGHESKRSTQSRWTITFIDANSHPIRSKNSPYFGSVLVWNDAATRANWLSAMLKARYPNNLTPPPNLVSIE
ncbi:arf-GAP with Rho-GAP domain, ANK repeat and PH domain-containing protein 2 [Diorhabda sublineata]|uniref:arf-GAP with Rho-GAP domain, ANK repeat and PH domain-containing protein 2 n=1 Tax=Diorhabda sublineata TaxID=1163346 RepID=UPI0024E06089|nr:arf-GAP with Rho-GAP domain, ANK repeat and PH domain-containing protein 2 [Diorhabda sublineata]